MGPSDLKLNECDPRLSSSTPKLKNSLKAYVSSGSWYSIFQLVPVMEEGVLLYYHSLVTLPLQTTTTRHSYCYLPLAPAQ